MFNQLAGVSTQTDTRYTGSQVPTAPTKLIVGGSETAETSLSATTTHSLTLRMLDKAVAQAKTMSPMIRPIMVGGKPHYVAFIHPNDTYQLRGQTSAGQWADIQRAVMEGGKIADNPIFTGALGVYNGVILHESSYVPVSTKGSDYRRCIFAGAQAGIIAFGQGFSANKMTWDEEMFDYGNKLGVSAGAIYGIKKAVFNSADFGVITMPVYSPDA